MRFRNHLFTIFFVFIFIFFLRPVGGDGDYYHHLNAGKDIITHHLLPHKDTYTFTVAGKEWIDHSWLSGVLFYLTVVSFGSPGVSVLISLVAVTTIYLLYILLKSYKVSRLASITTLALTAVAMRARFPSRPEVFAYPLIVSFLIIDRLRKHHPRLVFLFPLLTLAWANLYGPNVILADILVLLFFAKQLLSNGFKFKRTERLFYTFSLLSVPLSLLNGYGLKSLFYIYYIREIAKTQMEWFGIFKILSVAPYSYILFFQYLLLAYLMFAIVFIFAFAARYLLVRKYPFEFLLSLAVFAPFFAFRQAPLAAIVSAPALALLLSKIRYGKLIAAVAVGAVVISLYSEAPSFNTSDDYPKSLRTFIQTHHIKGNVIHAPQDGGYLSYYFYPDIKITADTRDELYLNTSMPDEFYRALSEKNLPTLARKYKADIVLGDLSEGEVYKDFFYSDTWSPVYIGGRYFIAVYATYAKSHHMSVLDQIDPYTFSGAKKGREKEAAELYKRLATASGWSEDKARYAQTLFALNRFDESLAVLNSISSSKDPRNALFNMNIDYVKTLAYTKKKDCVNAAKSLGHIDQGIKGVMLFTPWLEIPPLKDTASESYSSSCE